MVKWDFEGMSHRRLVCGLLALAYLFLMFGNGVISLTHPDEVFYIQTAKEMIRHKSWMTPYIFDKPQFEKPVFSYWLFVGAIKMMGLNPFAARFWPAVFGMIGVLTTYWLCFLLFRNKRSAFLSGVILATSFIYIALSRAVLTDMIFSIWVVLALTVFYWGYTDRTKKSLGIFLCFVISGVAVLTKGILGFIFPFGVIFLFLFYKKDFAFFKDKATFFGLLVFLALSQPWHILMTKLYGREFINEYWYNVHLRRIFDAEHPKSDTWYFYPMTVVGGIFPWTFFVIPAAYAIFQKFRRDKAAQDKFAFLFLWIVFVVGVMQVAKSKLASYIFPVFPAVAILMAYYFSAMLEEKKMPRLMTLTKIINNLMAFILCVGAVAAVVVSHKYTNLINDYGSVYLFSGLLFVCGIFLFIFNRRNDFTKSIVAVAFIVVIFLASVFVGYRNAEIWVSCKDITDAFKKIDQSQSTILCSKFYVRGVRYYTDRPVAVMDPNGKGFFSPHPIPYLNNEDKLVDFLRAQKTTFAIVKDSHVEDLKRIAQERGFKFTLYEGIGGKYIIKIQASES